MADTQFKRKVEKPEDKYYTVMIKFQNGDREYVDASEIKIFGGCLVIVDPKNCIPCEVHCYPLAQIRSFIFDFKAVEDGAVEMN